MTTSPCKNPVVFYMLQEHELRWLKTNKLINNASYIYLALKIENPFCDRPLKIKVKEFAMHWGIPESSVYECIAKLKELESITIQTKEVVITWRTSYQQEVDSENSESFRDSRMDSEIPESVTESQNGFRDSRMDSEIPESAIYKERARTQTNSDSSQTKSDFSSDSPLTPQSGGLDDEKSLCVRKEVPVPSQRQLDSSAVLKTNSVGQVPARDNSPQRNGRVRGVVLATRDGIPEVRVSMQGSGHGVPKDDFFGEDKPWSQLAAEAGSTPMKIHALASRWMAGKCRDKNDPKAYTAKILNGLAQDPNSKYNAVLWLEFEDAVLEQGVDTLVAVLEAEEAKQLPEPGQGFENHPSKDEWLELIKSQNLGWIDFCNTGAEDGTTKIRDKFYRWVRELNLFTYNRR